VRPRSIVELAPVLAAIDCRWLAEAGVGTVHVAADTSAALAATRVAAHAMGGWLLRESGAPDLEGFGFELPNAALLQRLKTLFDPEAKLGPGRLPLVPVEVSG
jgi:hypothetical protein